MRRGAATAGTVVITDGGVTRHTLSCEGPLGTIELPDAALPRGVDGYVVYMPSLSWTWEPYVSAGDACGSRSEAECAELYATALPDFFDFTSEGVVVARSGREVSAITLSEIVPAGAETVTDAVLHALSRSYQLECADPMGSYVEQVGSGFVVYGIRTNCDVFEGEVHVSATGDAEVRNERLSDRGSCAVVGRMTAGTPAQAGPSAAGLASYLGAAAALEEAAVVAFERLALELEHHGAPKELVEWAQAAADEERAHTHTVRELATARGAAPTPRDTRDAASLPIRPLAEVLRENVREGCVRETFGAAIGYHQLAHAEDASLRRALSTIAPDEAGHAALSWAIAEWGETQVQPDARAALRAERDRAVVELRSEIGTRDPSLLAPRACRVETPPSRSSTL